MGFDSDWHSVWCQLDAVLKSQEHADILQGQVGVVLDEATDDRGRYVDGCCHNPMTGHHQLSEGAHTILHLQHPPAGRPLGVLTDPLWTLAICCAKHLAGTTVEVHVEASHEILADHWCTRVLQDVDLDERDPRSALWMRSSPERR